MIKKNNKIFLAGHKGLVGSAIYRALKKNNYKNILVADRKELDLTDQKKTYQFLKKNKPKSIIIAAAKVGGIKVNSQLKGNFIYENLTIQNNLIHGAHLNKINNLIYLGSSCIYPKKCKQPIKEDYLLTGPLEKTNEPYAIAKIAGLKMCESYNYQFKRNYKCLMPCNTYGPNDNYNLNTSHFYPAILKKIHQATIKNKKFIELWGSGKPKRELIYVDDIAEACIYFMNKKIDEPFINIGSGKEKSIKEFAKFAIKLINPKLKIKFNKAKIDGTLRKILDNKKSNNYGWKPKIDLREGTLKAYAELIKK
jgi:GDP-L-fucose synthase